MDEQQFSPPPGVLNALLSNPELLGRIGTLLGNMQAPAPQQSQQPQTQQTQPSQSEPGENGGGGLASILADPAFIERLPTMLAAIKPMLGSVSVPPPESKTSDDCRTRLLLALKPYLSGQRRQALDTVLRLSKIGALLKTLN